MRERIIYPEDLKQLSINLIKALLTKERTHKELQEKLGISRSYLFRMASGKRIVSLNLCRTIARVYPDLDAMCTAIQLRKMRP
jgi:transcriptional regulator with XRE-family HTH domain